MARNRPKSVRSDRRDRCRVQVPVAGRVAWRILIAAIALLPAAAPAQDIRLEIPATTITTSTCKTHEDRGDCTLNVSLSLKPTANVTVQVSSADTTVANVSPATLTFTPQNYAERQSVAITGVDDDYYNDINGRHRKTTVSRVLAPHSDAGRRERGFGVTLTAEGGGRDGEGLSFSLSPRWGHAASGTGALWREQVRRGGAADPFAERWTVDARLEYARTLRRGPAITLSVGHSQSLGFEAGIRIGAPGSAAAAGQLRTGETRD